MRVRDLVKGDAIVTDEKRAVVESVVENGFYTSEGYLHALTVAMGVTSGQCRLEKGAAPVERAA